MVLSILAGALFSLIRIFVTNSIVNFVCLIHPILLYFVVFSGSSSNHHSAKDELIHLFKVVVFESLEMIYLAFFLPVKFARSNQLSSSDEIYINQRLVLSSAIFSLIISIILRSAFYLRERSSELQLSAKVSGKWISVPAPSDPQAKIPEWIQGASYD